MTHTPSPSDTSIISVFEGRETPVYKPINEHALQLLKCANDKESLLTTIQLLKKRVCQKQNDNTEKDVDTTNRKDDVSSDNIIQR